MSDKPIEPDSLDYTPQRMLEESLKDLIEGKIEATKAVVIFLNDEPDGTYHTNFRNAGMSVSQVIALLEIEKQKFVSLITGCFIRADDDEEDKAEDA